MSIGDVKPKQTNKSISVMEQEEENVVAALMMLKSGMHLSDNNAAKQQSPCDNKETKQQTPNNEEKYNENNQTAQHMLYTGKRLSDISLSNNPIMESKIIDIAI